MPITNPDEGEHILVDPNVPEIIEIGKYENLIGKCIEDRVIMRRNQLGEWETIYPSDSNFNKQPSFPLRNL